jgi:hypothetical protein
LLVAVATLATLANRIKVPYPILLVLGGLVLGFVPVLPQVELDPEVVFLLFLPPLLYVSAILTSWRDFRANLRPISLLAVGLYPALLALAEQAVLHDPVYVLFGEHGPPPSAASRRSLSPAIFGVVSVSWSIAAVLSMCGSVASHPP